MITTQATTIVRLIYENGVFRPHERIKAWLATWPDKLAAIPDTWWDEFDAFLNANRFDLPERDLGLGDE